MKTSKISLFEYFLSRKMTWLYIGYLILGCVFTSNFYGGKEYFDIFMGTLLHFQFRTVFMSPTFLLIFINLYQYIANQKQILIRLNTRQKVLKFEIGMIFKVTLFFFIIMLLIIAVFCNVIPKSGMGMTLGTSYQNSHAIGFITLSLLRIFLMLFTIGLLTLLISSKFNSQKYSIIIGLIIFLLLNTLTEILVGKHWYHFINPAYHAFGFSVTGNILTGFISGFIYYVIVISILIILLRKVVKKQNIGIYKK